MRLAVLLLTTASIRVAFAGPCHPGDVIARADRDLQVLAGVTCLEGSLELTRNVANLRPLQALTEIKGSLRVVMAERLSSLRGLDALTRIGGGIHIGGPKQGVPKLRGIDGLRSLVEIGGGLWIGGGYIFEPGKSRRSRIDGVSGLTSLARVGGSVQLWDVHGFRGLSALVEIGGDLEVSHCKFNVLAGFAKLERIGGSISFNNNQKLTRIDAAPKLASVGGDIAVDCLNENDATASLRLREKVVRTRFKDVAVAGTVWRVPEKSDHCWTP